MSDKILIGWGEADITPDKCKVELAGQYYQRMATGVHSRLKTVAMYLEQGTEHVLMISLDVVNFPENMQFDLRQKIHAALPEIAEKNIFLNATHTHNAPYTRPAGLFRDWLPLDPDAIKPEEYIALLGERVLAAAAQAWKGRKVGGIVPASGYAGIGHCRRAVYADGTAEMYGDTARDDFIGMEGGEDSGIEMLFTFDDAKNPTGLIVNIACPAQVMEATYLISSDYLGAAREKLKDRFGSGFYTLCQVAAAGCQSPRDLTRRYCSGADFWHEDGVDTHAERVCKAVMDAYRQTGANIDFSPVLRHVCRRVSLPVRRVSYQEYVAAAAELTRLSGIMPEKAAFDDFCRETHASEAVPGRPGPYDSKLHHFVLIQNAKAVVTRYENQCGEPEFSFDMQVVRIGDCAIVNNPFELYLVFGQAIRARSMAKRTFVVQLSGGSCGYLPSAEAEQYGGYGGLIINGKVGSEGGRKLVDYSVEAINGLFGDGDA